MSTQTVGIKTVQDQPLFDAIAQDVAPESSDTPLLLLDPTLRIRGCNSAYERVSRRRHEELIGQRVLDAFPDNPADSQADGTHNLQHSTDTAMGSDNAPSPAASSSQAVRQAGPL